MFEIIELAFSQLNIIPTVFLLLVIVYWVSVILGALDMGFLDFDLEPDYESDINIEADFDANAETEIGSTDLSGFTRLLWFFNIGKVPFMVFFTCWAVPTWFMCILSSYYLGAQYSWILSGLSFIVSLAFSLFIAKIITQPLVSIFKKMEMSEIKNIHLIGKECTAKYVLNSTKTGHALVNYDGSEFIIDAQTQNNKRIERYAKGFIIDYDKEKNIYIVEPIENV